MPLELARAVAVDKRFGHVVAVRAANCAFHAGQIHAVCGENGAGKSTLLKVVAGLVPADGGHVEVKGSRLEPATPREAIRRGIGMVLQHFALFPVMTVLENLVVGSEPVSGAAGRIDFDRARSRARVVAEQLGVDLHLDARVESLGVGDQQKIEIARALYRDASLVILDEPTAVLTKGEARALYATLRKLAQAGKGVVVVTHKMDEVSEHADVVTIMRRGSIVSTRAIDRAGDVAAQVAEVAAAIMGTSVGPKTEEAAPAETPPIGGKTVLEIESAVVGRALNGLSLRLRAGEIVGVAGVEGNGQRELVALLAGTLALDSGRVTGGPASVIREDRQTDGLVLDASLRDNVMLGELAAFRGPMGLLDVVALDRAARERIEGSGAPNEPDRAARTLSGGNQQKIVVARALARLGKMPVLVAAQPTRGVDIAASRDIHARLRAAAEAGAAVLVLSADLDELRALASRLLVLARGRIVAERPMTASDDELGRLMLGVDDDGAPS